MYNCEKCVHEELCDQASRQLWGHLTKETDCSDFKDQTNYVEVVRCKDCQFSKYFEESGTRKCRAQGGLYRTVQDDDFCSYGERREGE